MFFTPWSRRISAPSFTKYDGSRARFTPSQSHKERRNIKPVFRLSSCLCKGVPAAPAPSEKRAEEYLFRPQPHLLFHKNRLFQFHIKTLSVSASATPPRSTSCTSASNFLRLLDIIFDLEPELLTDAKFLNQGAVLGNIFFLQILE